MDSKTSKLYKKLRQSVVKVVAHGSNFEETGSGFVVSSEGHILTCWHVIETAEKLDVVLHDQSVISARHVSHNMNDDLALLKIEAKDLMALPLGDSHTVQSGNEVLLLGYPLISEGVTERSPSLISSVISNVTDKYLKLASPVGIGMSGGPVYHVTSDTVIGVAAKELTFITIDHERYPTGGAGFAVPINNSYKLLQGIKGTRTVTVAYERTKEFQRKVAGIYSSLGLQTVTDVEIAGQTIDICATIVQAGSKMQLAIKCMCTEEPIDREPIQEFIGTLSMVRRAGNVTIHKGVIISATDFTPRAKGLAAQMDIDLITYDDLVTHMLDFHPYLRLLIEQFSSSGVSHYLLESPCRVGEVEHESAVEYIDHVIHNLGHPYVAVLGDFGIGKTTLCRKLAYDLAKRCMANRVNSRIPIFISLKEYKTSLKIQETIIQTLANRFGLQIGVEALANMQRTGQLLFILDGFDEMAEKVDRVTVNENLREILTLAEITHNRLVITCRTHFFESRVDEEKLISSHMVRLRPWTNIELIKYLQRRFGESWEWYLDKIQNIFNLEELSKTPIFLDMIVESLPEIETRGDEITSSLLYEIYTDKWISTQEIRRGAVLSKDEKEILLEHLAYEMVTKDDWRINNEDLKRFLNTELNISEDRLERISNDIRTCSFLVRDRDFYIFDHTSFMEFFIAKKYFREIKNRNIEDFGKVYFKEEIFGFLLEMLNREEDLDGLHQLAVNCPIARARIHFILMLGRLQREDSKSILIHILEHDQSSRVSGHAAEILYIQFGVKDAFHKYIALLRQEPYLRDRSIPEEPNIGWFSVAGIRTFPLHDRDVARFFLQALSEDNLGDPNLRWYASSVLSRIANLKEFVSTVDFQNLVKIVTCDLLLPRARAYAALILGNLGKNEQWVVESLSIVATKDDDGSVRKAAKVALNKLKSGDMDIQGSNTHKVP